MANDLQMNLSNPVSGLGTFSHTVTAAEAGFITVSVQSTIPNEGSGTSLRSDQASPLASALQIVVNQNGSAKLTIGGSASNPTPTQQSIGSSVRLQCAAADVIAVVLSSANAIDAVPNAVKSLIDLYQGE